MANKLDKIVVVDVESTCWDKSPPVRLQVSEIIEIGVCLIDVDTFTIDESEGIFVLPQKSVVSQYCTDLTTITQEMLDKEGISIADACSVLRKKYNTNNRVWASWGDYDRRQFERQCKQFDVRYPFGPTHLNVKNLFAIQMGLHREVGMDEALKILEIDLEGTHHRGVDDAQNISKIACKLLEHNRKSLTEPIGTPDCIIYP